MHPTLVLALAGLIALGSAMQFAAFGRSVWSEFQNGPRWLARLFRSVAILFMLIGFVLSVAAGLAFSVSLLSLFGVPPVVEF
jgi:hypothetical protein